MWSNLNLLKGIFIGFGNYGQKLINIFDLTCSVEWLGVISKTGNKHFKNTSNIESLLGIADFIVIACPDPFHLDWLEYLSRMNYQGYIFCEKSPVVDSTQLKNLKNLKVFYNFPLIDSPMHKIALEAIARKQSISINWGHSFALKKEYIDNWRSDSRINPYGVGTSLAIHFVHLLIVSLNEVRSHKMEYINIAKTGSSPDTVRIVLTAKNKINHYINCSYSIIETQDMILDDAIKYNFIREDNLGNANQISNIGGSSLYPSLGTTYITEPFKIGNRQSVDTFLLFVRSNSAVVQDFNLIQKSLEVLFTQKNSSRLKLNT